jgi:hypothetical protein
VMVAWKKKDFSYLKLHIARNCRVLRERQF